MAGAAAQLIVSIIGDMKALKTTFSDLKTEIGGLGAGISKSGKDMSAMGGQLTAGVTAPILAVGAGIGVATNSAMTFDKNMNQVFTLLPNITQKGMDSMKSQTLKFSKDMGVGTTEISKGIYEALSAGVPENNVFEFLKQSEKLAIGGDADFVTSVKGLSSAVNAYGKENLNAATASDIMHTGVRLGKTTVAELSAEYKNVLPVASKLGVGMGDVTAAIATLTSQGTPTAEATTQIRQMLAELSKQGSKTAETFEKLTGKSFVEYIKGGGTIGGATKILTDNLGKTIPNLKEIQKGMTDLNDPTSELSKKFKDLTGKSFQDFKAGGGTIEQALDKLGIKYGESTKLIGDYFGSMEGGMAAMQLSGPGMEIYSNNLEQIGINGEKAAGATDAAFEKMDRGADAKMRKIKASIDVVIIQLGEKFMPILTDTIVPLITDTVIPAIEKIIPIIGGLVKSFTELSPTVRLIILGAIGLAAALGPLLVIAGTIISAFGAVATLLAGEFVASLIGILAPILLIVGAAVLLYEAVTNWDQLKIIISSLWLTIEQFFYNGIKQIELYLSGIDWAALGKQVMNTLIDGVVLALGLLYTIVVGGLSLVWNFLAGINYYQLAVTIFNTLKDGTIYVLGVLYLVALGALQAISDRLAATDLGKTGSTIWNTFIAGIKSVLQGPYTAITGALDTIKTWLSGVSLNSIAQTIWNTFIAGIKAVITGPYTAITGALNTIKTWLSGVSLNSIAQTIWNTFIAGVKAVIQGPYTAIVAAINTIRSFLSGINLSSAGTSIISTLRSGMMSALSSLESSVRSAISSVLSVISNAQSSISSALSSAQSAASKITSLASSAKSSGASIMSNLASGIASSGSWAVSTATAVVSKVANLFPHSPAKEGPLSKLPNWDTYFNDPINMSLNKIPGNIKTGLGNVAKVINNSSGQNNPVTSNNYEGDTYSIGPNTLSSGMDIKKLIEEIERYSTSQRRARGYIL